MQMPESESGAFTGTETMGAVLSPGAITREDDILILRGMIQQAQDVTTDPRISGDLTLEVNAYLIEKTFSGKFWGTMLLENAGGKWLAACVGTRTPEGVSTIYASGYGVGAYEGLFAKWTYTRHNPDPQMPFDIQGVITKLAVPDVLAEDIPGVSARIESTQSK